MTTGGVRSWAVAALLAAAACPSQTAAGQSTDALVEKLVQKGILTRQEAEELKKEAENNLVAASPPGTVLPDWVTSLNFSGDIRLRYDMVRPDSRLITDRERFRFRLRFGAVATLQDDFEVGFRLASTTDTGSDQSGNPISTNQTFQDNANRKAIGIDLAYVKWSPLDIDGLEDAFVVGKMNNPFNFSEMVFDPDYTPEGFAQDFSLKLNEYHRLDFGAGEFILDELLTSGRDPWLFAGDLLLQSTWSEEINSSFGLGTVNILHPESLTSAAVPNVGRGNTRDTSGALVYDFNVLIVDGSVTYTMENAPFYPTSFPITFAAEYIHNFGARGDNNGFAFGPTFGKAGRKRQWEVSYKYKYLGGDAMYEEIVDSDFMGFYIGRPVGEPASATFPGTYSGTNIRGHVFRVGYSPFDSLLLLGTVWINDLIEEIPPGAESSGVRFVFDATWKF